MKKIIVFTTFLIANTTVLANQFNLPVTIHFDTSAIASQLIDLTFHYGYQCGNMDATSSNDLVSGDPVFNVSCDGKVNSYQFMGYAKGENYHMLQIVSESSFVNPAIETPPTSPLCSLDALSAHSTYDVKFSLEPFYGPDDAARSTVEGYYLHCNIS